MLYCYRVYITEISYLVRNNIFAINSSSQLHLVFNITIKLCEACHYRKGQNLENPGRGDGSTRGGVAAQQQTLCEQEPGCQRQCCPPGAAWKLPPSEKPRQRAGRERQGRWCRVRRRHRVVSHWQFCCSCLLSSPPTFLRKPFSVPAQPSVDWCRSEVRWGVDRSWCEKYASAHSSPSIRYRLPPEAEIWVRRGGG